METPTATYGYHDADWTLLSQKLRFETMGDSLTTNPNYRTKRFVQRRPLPRSLYKFAEVPEGHADDVWVWGLSAGEYGRKFDRNHDLYPVTDDQQCSVTLPHCPLVLYRLPELLAANPDHPVFLVEGEKDVETLRGLGFVATCTPNGSGGVPDWSWFSPLAGRRVVVCCDNDYGGKKHGQMQAGILLSGGVRSLRILWPGEYGFDVGDGGDITDWIDQRTPDPIPPGTEDIRRKLVIDLCRKFPEYKC